MHPSHSHWLPHLVPRAQLAERILGMPAAEAPRLDPALLRPSERHNVWLGFLGEAEVVRRLAMSSRLDLFRPFPDLEMVEVLARDNVTGHLAGLQVKTASVSPPWGEAQIHVRKATLSRASDTWRVGLAWRQEVEAFDDECLFIPAAEIPEVGTDVGPSVDIHFHPTGPERTRLDRYRRQLAELDRLVTYACAAGSSW